jgi:ribosomal protein S19E (S16A)
MLKYSRWTDPGADAPAAVRIDQFLTDLAHYRDDAHNAAWMPYGISGTAWEALTFVWREDARTPEALAEALPFRGHTADRYVEALAELAERGWVEETAEGYQVTERGGKLRQKAEDETNRFHSVGWSTLSDDELGKLSELLTRLAENLRRKAHRQIWGLLGELPQHLIRLTRDVVTPLFEKHGLDQPGMFFVLYRANGLAPEPITVDSYAIGNPYTNRTLLSERLSQAAEVGHLRAEQDGVYRLTEEGKAALDVPNHAFYSRLGELDALPAEDLTRLESLVAKIADVCRDAPEPANKPSVSIVHNGHPQEKYSPLAKIDQHLDDLRAFRDDVHIAAWEPYGVSGHAWEAFTFIWRNDAKSAEELQGRLEGRGHSVETYQQALDEMKAAGWLSKSSEGYQLTDKGQSLRQEAEEQTDRYFFAPWAALNSGETAQVHHLLTRLRDSLQGLGEAAKDEG